MAQACWTVRQIRGSVRGSAGHPPTRQGGAHPRAKVARRRPEVWCPQRLARTSAFRLSEPMESDVSARMADRFRSPGSQPTKEHICIWRPRVPTPTHREGTVCACAFVRTSGRAGGARAQGAGRERDSVCMCMCCVCVRARARVCVRVRVCGRYGGSEPCVSFLPPSTRRSAVSGNSTAFCTDKQTSRGRRYLTVSRLVQEGREHSIAALLPAAHCWDQPVVHNDCLAELRSDRQV